MTLILRARSVRPGVSTGMEAKEENGSMADAVMSIHLNKHFFAKKRTALEDGETLIAV